MAVMRRLVRSTLERTAIGMGLAALARRTNPHRVAILAYHNIVPDTEAGRGDASLHLPLSEFLRQIDRIERSHDIVELDEAASVRESTRPRAVITFDDAYRGAVTLALPELVRRGLPAVVFVAPALLGSRTTWWDEIADISGLPDVLREAALRDLAGRSYTIRRKLLGPTQLQPLPASYGIASEDELERNCRARIRVGSHSWSHEYLPALPAHELRASLRAALKWLDGYPRPTTRWLALPYGGTSPLVRSIALDIGHTGVLEIEGGLWRAPHDRSRVPRLNVPAGVSPQGIELRLSGLRR